MTKRFCKGILAASLGCALQACTPGISGICQTNLQCKSDETCSGGLCLRSSSLLGADGGPGLDGGSGGYQLQGGGLGSGESMQSQHFKLNGTFGGAGIGASSATGHSVVDSSSRQQRGRK